MFVQDTLNVINVDEHAWSSAPDREVLQAERKAADDLPICFRNFELWPTARLLLRAGDLVCIGSRAFDLLVVLLQSRGSVVSKAEIVRNVWPSTIVEESNLRFQIGSLRNALGQDRDIVKSIPGRGYLLACDPLIERNPGAALSGYRHELTDVIANGKSVRRVIAGSSKDSPLHTGDTNDENGEVLDNFLRVAGSLVANYGSLEAVLGALGNKLTAARRYSG